MSTPMGATGGLSASAIMHSTGETPVPPCRTTLSYHPVVPLEGQSPERNSH